MRWYWLICMLFQYLFPKRTKLTPGRPSHWRELLGQIPNICSLLTRFGTRTRYSLSTSSLMVKSYTRCVWEALCWERYKAKETRSKMTATYEYMYSKTIGGFPCWVWGSGDFSPLPQNCPCRRKYQVYVVICIWKGTFSPVMVSYNSTFNYIES